MIPTSKVSSTSHHPSFTSSPQHFSTSLPLNTPTAGAGVGKRTSYVDMHLAKLQHSQAKLPGSSPKRTGSASGRKGSLEPLAASMSSRLSNDGGSPLFTHRTPFPPPVGKRHNSLSGSIRPADVDSGGYHGPLAGEDHHFPLHGSYMHHGMGPPPTMQHVHPTSMSVTWPKAYGGHGGTCLLYTSPSPRDATLSRMPSSA